MKINFWIAPLVLATSFAQAQGVDISRSGWRLWLDREAKWKDDPLFLPSEVKLSKLPVKLFPPKALVRSPLSSQLHDFFDISN